MNRKYLLAGASALAASMLAASPAFAAGALAGSDIVNTARVNYAVAGVNQTEQTASNTMKVDRRILFTLTEDGNATTLVAPDARNQVTTFVLTNNSNAVLDFGLSLAQITGGTAVHGGTDRFNASNVRIFVDNPTTGTVGSYDAGDTETNVNELAIDTTRRIFVLGDIPAIRTAAFPAGVINGDVAGVTLTAQAREGGNVAAQGAVVTQETTANDNATMQTVFADGATPAERDGRATASDDYTVGAAALTVTKTSTVLSDPFSSSNPKMIPGAVVSYCISIANAPGSATATGVAISDALPADTTYVASSAALGTVCGSGGTATGTSFASNTVSATVASVAAGETRTLYFNVTID